jgi:hypothetical protein
MRPQTSISHPVFILRHGILLDCRQLTSPRFAWSCRHNLPLNRVDYSFGFSQLLLVREIESERRYRDVLIILCPPVRAFLRFFTGCCLCQRIGNRNALFLPAPPPLRPWRQLGCRCRVPVTGCWAPRRRGCSKRLLADEVT